MTDARSFVIARFLASIFMGAAAPNIATYLVEILPRQLNSRLSVLAYAAYALGSLLCSLAARALLPIADWRLVFAIGGVVPLVLLTPLLIWLLPESPRFLVTAGRSSEAVAASLRKVCGSSVAFVRDARFVLNSNAAAGAGKKSFIATARTHARAVGLLSLFALLVYFTSISMSSMSTTILTSIGLPLTDAVSILMALNVGGLIGALLAAFTIEKYGSKPTLLALLACAVICLSVLSKLSANGSSAQVPVLTVLYALTGFGLTSSLMILYPLAAQAFPTEVRSTLTGGIASVGRVGSIASSAVIALLLVSGGASIAFAGVAVATGFAIIAALAFNRHMGPVAARE
jgi:AAHS family 4-hydroxybenzoate transporter-like MFS transporter